MNSCRFEFFPQLNGFRAKIPFLGGILIVSNMEYLENSQNIYSFPIRSKYHILYFFFDAPQEIIFLEDNPAHAIHIPSDSVLAITKGIAHQFVFSPRKRPCILNIYYQFTYNSVLPLNLRHLQNMKDNCWNDFLNIPILSFRFTDGFYKNLPSPTNIFEPQHKEMF